MMSRKKDPKPTEFNTQGPSTPPAPSPVDVRVEVKAMSFDNVVDGKIAVYETGDINKVYLVDVDRVKFTVKAQTVPAKLLEESVRPYMWSEELMKFTYTLGEMRLALIRAGYTSKCDVSFKEILATLLKSGVLPIVHGKE